MQKSKWWLEVFVFVFALWPIQANNSNKSDPANIKNQEIPEIGFQYICRSSY